MVFPVNDNSAVEKGEDIIIREQDAGWRLDQLLAKLTPGVSRSQIQRSINDGVILLNKQLVSKKKVVSVGDVITVLSLSPSSSVSHMEAQNIPLVILYEDEHLLAVNKPAGMVVHPGNGTPDGTLVNALLYRCQALSDGFNAERPGIVHRLDKGTSGVLLVAKTNRVHALLANAFAERTIHKEYIGLCIGRPNEEVGTIAFPLGRNQQIPIKRSFSPTGKNARTHFQLISHHNGISIIAFHPLTGRTHQIRAHCSTTGFPIVADELYGGGRERLLRINPLERPFAFAVHKCFSRHALHAMKITFNHPVNDEMMTITAPFPEDFKAALTHFSEPESISALREYAIIS